MKQRMEFQSDCDALQQEYQCNQREIQEQNRLLNTERDVSDQNIQRDVQLPSPNAPELEKKKATGEIKDISFVSSEGYITIIDASLLQHVEFFTQIYKYDEGRIRCLFKHETIQIYHNFLKNELEIKELSPGQMIEIFHLANFVHDERLLAVLWKRLSLLKDEDRRQILSVIYPIVADSEDSYAVAYLGECLLIGIATEKDERLGALCYFISAEQGKSCGAKQLGLLSTQWHRNSKRCSESRRMVPKGS